ncbi:MAG: CRISPR system precrRNA processing endoribonuclease RAMP protein Cas6 [Oscillospiraceae bacterium]
MIKQLVFSLEPLAENIPPSVSYKIFGFICHSDKISEEFKNLLHTSDCFLSQYIKYEENHIKWIVNLLNSTACENVLNWLLSLETLELGCISFNISLLELFTVYSFDDLQIKSYDLFQNSDLIKITFDSPFSFRNYQNRNYMLFPEESCLFHSITSKWNGNDEIFSEFPFYDEDIVSLICENIYISSYSLNSHYFNFKKLKIPASKGYIILSLKKLPDDIKRFVYILLYYIRFSGVGMHTSLGMGGCYAEPYFRSKSDDKRKR